MITYVKSQEAQLFTLAADELGVQSLSLEQYLRRLGELYSISPRFVRLPLYEDGHKDEEIFEIDANARTITIPSSFAKNGVGVVSDELAETLWFRINRYFDIKDFGKAFRSADNLNEYDKPHILIEWEAPDGVKGASWAYAIDAETDDDYVYFGWALTSDHLTAKAGQIKFAVRILQYNVDGIAYSFATQVASVTIKPTLELDLTAEDLIIESVADKISNRIMGGQIAFCPVFIDTPSQEEGEPPIRGDLDEYLANIEGGVETARLTVKAGAPGEETYDAMAYIWYKKGKGETEFSEVTDGDGAYTPSLAVTSSGQYYVVVYGMKEIIDKNMYTYDENSDPQVSEDPFWYHSSVASTKSTVCEIPEPTPLVIKSLPSSTLLMDGTYPSVDIVLVGRQQLSNLVRVGAPNLGVEIAEDGAVEGADAGNWLLYTPASGQIILEPNNDEEADPTRVLKFNTYTEETVEGGEGEEPTVVRTDIDEAYYKFTVLNSLNGDTAATEQQFICRITKPARAIEATLTAFSGQSGAALSGNGSAAREDVIRVIYTTTPNATFSDKVTIDWYKVKVDIDPSEDAADLPDDLLIQDGGLEYTPQSAGAYYAKITNRFNGDENQIITNTVIFND